MTIAAVCDNGAFIFCSTESAQILAENVGGSKRDEASTISSTRPNSEATPAKKFKDDGAYASRKAARKEARKLKTELKKAAEPETPYRNGFSPQSFDRVLLDAPCSALGLRPRLFAGQVRVFAEKLLIHVSFIV